LAGPGSLLLETYPETMPLSGALPNSSSLVTTM